MLYRENGQFKSTYASDQQMLPILQDRVVMFGLLAFAFEPGFDDDAYRAAGARIASSASHCASSYFAGGSASRALSSRSSVAVCRP